MLVLLLFITERLATRVVAISLTYAADLIIVAYILVVAAAIIFTIRRRMSAVKTVILLIGLAVLGYVLKDTFIPVPAAPYSWDALVVGITLVAGIALPFVYPPLRRAIHNSSLLRRQRAARHQRARVSGVTWASAPQRPGESDDHGLMPTTRWTVRRVRRGLAADAAGYG